jgi:deoxyhypusine synthase
MPFLIKALLDKRDAYDEKLTAEGEEQLFSEDPKARGYLRSRTGYRLFDKRDILVARLKDDVRDNAEWLRTSVTY